MTTTAILSALGEEQQGLLERLENPRPVTRAGREFWLGTLHGESLVLGQSRIGKVAAATTAVVLIEAFSVARIVFTGVAGALGAGVNVGDVVVAARFVQHDMDASPLFPRFEVPLYQQSHFTCDAMLTGLLLEASRYVVSTNGGHLPETGLRPGARIHQGLIASGDRFVSTAAEAAALKLALGVAGMDALAVEMEGAAVAQVCQDYGVPFAAARTISDRADEHAATDFQHFVTHVARHYALGMVDHLVRALAKA